MKSRNSIPTEYEEAVELADWLRANGYAFHHSPNESGQAGTRNILIMMRKKKLMGVSKGFPDYTIILKRGSVLFLELKRQKGPKGGCPSTISPEQEEWLRILDGIDNCAACVAYGAKEAIEIVKSFDTRI